VAAADLCDRLGLQVPSFDDGAQEKLREAIPAAGTSLRNPLDMGVPLVVAPVFERVLDVVAGDKNIETVIATQGMFHVLGGTFRAAARAAGRASSRRWSRCRAE